jgi:hypothetical protein
MRKTYIAILGALAVTALACGSPGEDEDAAPAPGAAQEQQQTGKAPAKKPAKAAPGIGQPARDGKFEFTVTKLDCSLSKVGTEFAEQKAQGKFCLAHLTVKNVGDEAQMFDASSQKAFDAAGTTYDADGAAALYVNEGTATFLNNINPGNQVKGVIPFDVPKNVTVTRLELHDSPFSGGVTVSVAK